jgi:acetyl-CoA synthetase
MTANGPLHRHDTAPNLDDYDAVRERFSWQAAWEMLDGLPAGGINMAHEAVDRHVTHGRGDRVALRWLGKDGSTRDITYAELAGQSSRWANALDDLGVEAGASVFTLLGRVPALYVAVMGALKHRNVVSPLFSVFGPEPIRQRLQLGHGRVLVTTPSL